MDIELSGRRALITGGSLGIGRATASLLAQEGASVFICGRSPDTGETVVAELRDKGLQAAFIQADTNIEEDRVRLAETLLANGGVDILVNNVGGTENPGGGARGWFGIPISEWDATYNMNVTGAVRLCQLLVPAMQARKWGRIINISSAAGLEPGNEVPADYSASKAAMNTMTISLARALAKSGVTANAISPGPILTLGFQGWIDVVKSERGWPETGVELERRFAHEMFDLGSDRLGRPEDIAFMAAFLASPRADYVTGGNFRVDGGFSRAAL
jgi:3-oxoacyl-[acyl-carrier protein] reductase